MVRCSAPDQRNAWSFFGLSAETYNLQQTLAFFLPVAQRNYPRPRRRFLRARYLSPNISSEVWGAEARCVGPPADEDLPFERPDNPLKLPENFSLPHSSLDRHLAVQSVRRPGDPRES